MRFRPRTELERIVDSLNHYNYNKKNAEIVASVMEELSRIHQVVEQNVEIAQSSNQISTALAGEVENLLHVCKAEQ